MKTDNNIRKVAMTILMAIGGWLFTSFMAMDTRINQVEKCQSVHDEKINTIESDMSKSVNKQDEMMKLLIRIDNQVASIKSRLDTEDKYKKDRK